MQAADPFDTLAVGDIIYADIFVDPLDLADPNSQSTTAKKIKKIPPQRVRRLCIVLAKGTGTVDVTYTSTFKGHTQLPVSPPEPRTVDKSMWMPVDPAVKEGTYEVLPQFMGDQKPSWVSLRKKQTITKAEFGKVLAGIQCPADSVQKIAQNMKA